MYPWPRRTIVSYRSIKTKLQNIPQQLCKACLRLLARVCEDEYTRFSVIIFIFCTLCCVLFGWIFFRDPCFQWEIRKSLCEDYKRGMIAGSLCYSLCIEDVAYMYTCVEETEDVMTFRWDESLVKVRRFPYDLDQTHSVWEGITHREVGEVLERYFTQKLGPADHSMLIERVVKFSDFNEDNTIQYGEIYSVWQLLQIPEFLLLFLFHKNSVFPALNGTCGTMYLYEDTYYKTLFVKTDTSLLDQVFPHRYRWGFPGFPQRVHIALGLLEYVDSVMEVENTRFYMCDLSPTNFGYTQYFHMKVSNLDGIVSEAVLNESLGKMGCVRDDMCVVGSLCMSSCDRAVGRCQGISSDHKPDLVKICEILFDYVLYDTPSHLRLTLQYLISKCYRTGRSDLGKSLVEQQLEKNYVIDHLNEVLWNELKDEKNPWMYRPTPSPYRK